MNIFRRLMARFGKQERNSGKIKIRGRMGRTKIKGGRFARKLHRQWAQTHRTYVPGQIGLSAVSEAIMKDYGRILPRRKRRRRYYNGEVIRRGG
jgi:hypothetical protein